VFLDERSDMMRWVALAAVIALMVSASVARAEITASQVAGKVLQGDNKSRFTVGVDGTLTGITGKGDALSGSWEVKGGNWCRTIKEPVRLAGSACQAATINDKTLTLTNQDGSSISYKIK
jgi:hypothetical protein